MSNIVSPGFTTPWIFREMPGVVSEGGGEGSSFEGRGWMEIPMRKMAMEIGIIGMIRFITPPTHMAVGTILYNRIIPSTQKSGEWHIRCGFYSEFAHPPQTNRHPGIFFLQKTLSAVSFLLFIAYPMA